ncbi:MAG: glycoside hydrolase family 43 protein [Acidobacteriota bacterium]|nr:glycoside hydrolase family 43 protein [Acidobacteriota bacterium]
MTENSAALFAGTYLNPVYPHSFPDPFVLKFRGEYFAYCTGLWRDGKVFGVLRSRDLVNWQEIGGAMQPLANDAPFYWAPEVTYHNGRFYLYYSVGNETLMELRVAVSDRPDGGFVDSGHKLTTEDFAIDAHVFEDEDGARYLFYATDFLEHTHIGTGTVVDRMIDFFTLEGKPRPVTRARYDWQVYDPQRKEKGGVRWHTVEGAFVFKRKGVYYEMFSGGNWQNITYGVSFAVTGDIEKDEEWTQFSDGEKVFPILRTIPGLVIGPGHNSAVRGANNRELYCVYHRWTDDGRVLAIDRMDFAGGARIFISGATYTPQPAPFEPKALDFFDMFSAEDWRILSGYWRVENNQLICETAGKSEVLCEAEATSFLCETWLRAAENAATGDESGAFGVCLKNGAAEVFRFLLVPGEKQAFAAWMENGVEQTRTFALSEDFDFQAFHLLRVEVDSLRLKISLDENAVRFEKILEASAPQISLFSKDAKAAFSGFALTAGFEDLFENANPEKRGWRKISAGGAPRVEGGNLIIDGGNSSGSGGENETILCKDAPPSDDFELAINFRFLDETPGENSRFGVYPSFDETAAAATAETPFFAIEKSGENWILKTSGGETFPLPKSFSPAVFHQFRFLKIKDKFVLQLEAETLGIVEAPRADTGGSGKIALSVRDASAAFDMVRLSAL